MYAPFEVESLVVAIREDMNAAIYLRVGRAMETLVGAIKEAYARPQGNTPEGIPLGFTASHGSAGAIGAVNWEVKRAENFIEATIGLADSARYLRNLEFGESGTEGAPSTGAIFARSLAPPVKTIYQWVLLAHIETPDYFKERAERFQAMANSPHAHPAFDKNKDKPWYSTDENMQFAYAIAMKRKRLGRPAMHVILRTTEQYTERIKNYLSGTAS